MRLWQVALILVALVAWATWPFVTVLGTGVTDLGDPLLNSWALAWNAHAIATHPSNLVNGNIFHPETATVAFSELLWLPSLVVAPLLWAGADPILAHNVLVFGGWVLSGLLTFVLVRKLTEHDGASLVAAVAFALYPYRTETFPKVQLALTVFWPLALIGIHGLLTSARWRPVAVLGLALAAECYSCVYLGVFGGMVIGLVGIVAIAMARQWTGLGRLALAGVAATLLVVPLIAPYRAASAVVGERSIEEVRSWSAKPADYLRAHPENWLYGDPDRMGQVERRLFPGFTAPALALAALAPPVAPPVFAYVAGAIASVDLSLGTNGPGYEWLFEHVSALRALRVPARFGLVTGLMCAVLAGFGIRRLVAGRPQRIQIVVVTAAIMATTAEGAMRSQEFSRLPEAAPTVYAWLAEQPDGVVCEYPVGQLEGRAGPQDPTYMYYSTKHWKPLVNGYSGFLPSSYHALLAGLQNFPDDAAIAALRTRDVAYLIVHEPFYISNDYSADVASLRGRTDLVWAGRFRWKNGMSSDAFRLVR
jgi:hypothetical protein